MQSKEISAFWQLFQQREKQLTAINTANHPLYDELLEKLQEIDEGLWFEFSSEPGNCEFIITAEGCQSLFPLVEDIVAAAPNVPGWKILPLKPKTGFPKTAQWENLEIQVADVVFDPLEREGSHDLGLRILVPGIKPQHADSAHNAILRAIDHGLGERAFAENVQYTEVLPFPRNAVAEDYIPLAELENYIAWRNKKLESKR